MGFVEPIKDIESINKMKAVLWQESKRNYLLFVLGINTGIRIHDLLNLQVKDVWDGDKAKDFLIVGTETAIYLNHNVREALNSFLSGYDLSGNDFVFNTRKSDRPMSRQHAYRIINQAAKEAGIQDKVGTHTLRKTFGYHAYNKGIAISLIQAIYGHSSPSETLKYLGIDHEEQKKLIKVDVNL
jgi:site-specific recombinase XerD